VEFFPAGAAVTAAFFYHFHSIPFFNQQNKFNFFSSVCSIFASFLHLLSRRVNILNYFPLIGFFFTSFLLFISRGVNIFYFFSFRVLCFHLFFAFI